MGKPELLSEAAGRSAASLVDEMSRLYYMSRAIHVAAELGIADHVGDEPTAVTELAEQTGTNALALKRLLRFLSAYRVFEEKQPDVFGNTTLSSVLRDDHVNSVRANLRRIGEFWWSAVGQLEHSIRTGEAAFEHVHGVPFFKYLGEHPDIQKRFDDAMARISDKDDAAIAEAYDFTRFSRIVDVGGGKGGLLVQILSRAPKATGILFDQPQVINQATRLTEAWLSDRVELLGGDFFESVPEGCDCYVIKGVLHDFDDNQCAKILTQCREAVTDDGRIVIANQDLPSPIEGPHPNLTMDIQMMALLGGRERSVVEWTELFSRADFRLATSFQTSVGFTLIEGVPD